MPTLGSYLNQTILVSIPSVFEDGRPRPFKLVGIELCGLWLASSELAVKLHLREKGGASPSPVSALFPFAQIAYILERTPAVLSAAGATADVPPQASPPAKAGEGGGDLGPPAAPAKTKSVAVPPKRNRQT